MIVRKKAKQLYGFYCTAITRVVVLLSQPKVTTLLAAAANALKPPRSSRTKVLFPFETELTLETVSLIPIHSLFR